VGATIVAACGSDNPPPAATPASTSTTAPPFIDVGDGGHYRPTIDPAGFASEIDNPYMPLAPGSRWRYEGTADGARQTTEITVLDGRKRILGIDAIVVRDVVKENGQLIEDTYDWFAQDRDGNVWYFGETVKDYEDGVVVSTAGSWQAGVDGARPGIVMPASPEVGAAYRQEFYPGEAEDMMQVTATGRTLRVPAGAYSDVVVTNDWTPLEPDVVEEKFYAPGVGRILERKTTGGRERSALVEYQPGV
jgi:hypothetical protein